MTIRRWPAALLALLTTAVIGTAACSSQPDEDGAPLPAGAGATSSQGTTSVQGAPVGTPVRQLDPKAFAEALKQPGVVVLDVRTPAEYAGGHLAKAINMDMEAADFTQRIAALDKSSRYAIYCRTGRRSALAAEQMRAAGFTVMDMVGGVVAWTGAGNKLVTG